MERQELRILLAIIDTGGFRKAAEELLITQSAVSQGLANLERKLNATLLERSTPPTLTEAGSRVAKYARATLRAERETLDDLDNMQKGLFSTLSLAVNGAINALYCPSLLARFRNDAPRARLKIQSLPSRAIIYSIASDKCELGFGPFQRHMAAFDMLPLFTEKRVLAVGHTIAGLETAQSGSKKFLQSIPLLTSYLDRPEKRPHESKLRDRFQAVWEINSASLRLALVQQGFGATYVEERILRDHPNSDAFTALTWLPFGEISRTCGLYYTKGRKLSVAAERFIDICKDYFADRGIAIDSR